MLGFRGTPFSLNAPGHSHKRSLGHSHSRAAPGVGWQAAAPRPPRRSLILRLMIYVCIIFLAMMFFLHVFGPSSSPRYRGDNGSRLNEPPSSQPFPASPLQLLEHSVNGQSCVLYQILIYLQNPAALPNTFLFTHTHTLSLSLTAHMFSRFSGPSRHQTGCCDGLSMCLQMRVLTMANDCHSSQ